MSNLGQTLLIPSKSDSLGATPTSWAVFQGLGAYASTSNAYVIANPIGVPAAYPNFTHTTEQWWAGHWANPTGFAHIPVGSIQAHSNTVSVGAGADLQAAIDAAPDNTTFVLAANGGPYSRVSLDGRSGIHIVAADAAQKPTLRGFEAYTNVLAESYFDWVDNVLNNVGTSRYTFLYPSRDIVLKNLKFVSDGTLIALDSLTGRYEDLPILMHGMADVLIEGCTFDDYIQEDASHGSTGAPAGPHPALIIGTGGVRNWVVRNCTLDGQTNGGNFGFPYAVYFDGAAGCAIVDCTLTGKWHSGNFLFLTNDDFSRDWDDSGTIDNLLEIRNARYNAVYRNTCTRGATHVGYTGQNLLHAANVLATSGNISRIVYLATRCGSSEAAADGVVFYPNYDNVTRDNSQSGGNITVAWVQHDTLTDGTTCGAVVGRTTITGNSSSGTVVASYDDDGNTASTGPHVVSGNSWN